MTHEVRTPPLQPAAVAAGAAAAEHGLMDYVDAALEGLWHLLTSMRFGMALMIVLAALCVAGSMLMQLPSGMEDTASRQMWLDSIKPRYGGRLNLVPDVLALLSLLVGSCIAIYGAMQAKKGEGASLQSVIAGSLIALGLVALVIDLFGLWMVVLPYAPGVLTVVLGVLTVAVGLRRMSRGVDQGWLTALGGALLLALGAVVVVADPLGFFNIFNGTLFRVLVAWLTISLIACSVHRVPGAWRTATKPRVDVGPGFFEHAPQHEQIVVHATSVESLAKVHGVLKQRRYRTLVQDDGTVHVYADRFRFVAFASLAGHISLVLILLGAIVGATFGFKNQYFVVPEGSTVLTGTEAGLSMKLIDFTDSYYSDTGAPKDYTSQVLLLKDGQQVAAQTIRVNEPLSYDGATYYQRAFGPGVALTIKDASGQVVYSEGMPLDGTSTDGSDRSAGSLTIPGTGDVINVFATNGTTDTVIQPGQVQVVLYAGGANTATGTSVIDQGKSQKVGTYMVTFERELKYTVLSISKDPGQILVWLGALILFAGFTLVFLLPQRRVWARISSRGAMSVLSVASLGRRDAALGTDFEDLITDIRAALQAPAQA